LYHTSEGQNYFYTSLALAHKSRDRPGISTQQNEQCVVISDGVKMVRTDNKGTFCTAQYPENRFSRAIGHYAGH